MTASEARQVRANMMGGAVRILLAVVLALGLAPGLPASAFAADGSVNYVGGMESWNDPNGYLQQSCYMEVDGNPAMCCEHFKDTPSQGSSVTSWGTVNDGSMRKILFYGAGGPGDTGAYSLVQTACALSNAYGTTEAVASAWPIVNDLASRPEPPASFVVTLWAGGGSTQRLCSWTYNPSGFIDLDKDSANPAITDGNGCYSLAGAVYGVFGSWADANNRANPVTAIVTDANGYGRTGELAVGTYYVRETQNAPGYGMDGAIYEVAVAAGATVRVNGSKVYDPPKNDPAGVLLSKHDGDKTYGSNSLPQGSASLALARFTVRYYDSFEVTAENYGNRTPKRTWVMQTDERGAIDLALGDGTFTTKDGAEHPYKVSGDDFYRSSTGKIILPLGTLVIQETASPEGYDLPDPNPVYVQQITGPGTGELVNTYNPPTIPEPVIRGGVSVEKRDVESMLRTPLGGATLDGVTLEIRSLNDNEVVVDDVSYGEGDVVKTLVVRDCVAATAPDALPYGHYSISEKSANAGYSTSDAAIEFSIVNPGEIVRLHGDAAVKNQVKRGDIEFTKKHGVSAASMANVPFALTSETTGERHIVVTDENGYFSSASAFNPHTRATNANDNAPAGAFDLTAGIWFGKTAEGTTTAPDDDLAALPYDTYVLEELPCAANAGLQLVKIEGIAITRDAYTVDLGSVDDPQAAIATSASDSFDGDKIVVADKEASVTDRVSFSNLIAGRTYRLSGTLLDKEAGGALASDGNPVTGAVTFTPETPSGYVDVTFNFEASALAGKELVAAQELSLDGRLLASHIDMDDAEQTVEVVAPRIATAARDAADGDKEVAADPEAGLVDAVAFRNVLPGREYVLHGKIADKATGAPLLIDGREVTSTLTFTPEAAEGTVDMAYDIDASALAGRELVVYEELFRDGAKVAEHADVNDAGQTVLVVSPEIGTTAMSAGDFDQIVEVDPEARIIDRVSYRNLVKDADYTLKASLVDKASGEPVKGAHGAPVASEASITPADDNGSIDVALTLDTSALAGHELVVFEELYRDGKLIAEHADINDAAQTVLVAAPTLVTDAAAAAGGGKEVVADPHAGIVDAVEYAGVIAGNTYKLTAALVDYDTGEVLVTNNKVAVESAEFTALDTYGAAQVAFEIDASALAGKKLVVYETLSRDGVKLAEHADIGDMRQTVNIVAPKLATVALDATDADKDVTADPEARVVDTVSYSRALADAEYTLNARIVDAGTGEPLRDEQGAEVAASATFTTLDTYGSTQVTFDFDASALANKSLVVFQELSREGKVVATHADINDAAQTFQVVSPELSTKAFDGADGDKTVVADPEAGLIDEVSYKNLVPKRNPYTLKGILMDKGSGEPLKDAEGEPVTSEATFTPEASFGTVDMAFALDASALAGRELVVFEELYRDGMLIAKHADLGDAAQTVLVKAPELSTVALDAVDGDKLVVADPEARVVDTVSYSHALADAEYTLNARIVDAGTGEPLRDEQGAEVAASATFTTFDTYGSTQVTFDFDASALAGESYVVVQELSRAGKVVATHADIADAEQTFQVTAPEIGTEAADGIDADKTVVADGEAFVVDTVSYENLVPARPYKLAGTLMDKETGEALKDAEGAPVTSEATFTPEKPSGSVEVAFAFDASLLAGKELVAFESLSRLGREVAVHAEIDDAAQMVEVVQSEIATSAADGLDGDKTVVADPAARVIDTLEYRDAVPGGSYEAMGVIVDKGTGLPLLAGEGAKDIAPERLEAFWKALAEAMGFGPVEEEPGAPDDDAGALKTPSGEPVGDPDGEDVESGGDAPEGEAPFKPVDPDYEAVAKLLADNADIASLMADGLAAFAPEAPEGTVEVAFDLDASMLAGADAVVFEALAKDGRIVAVHADIADEGQTVAIVASKIATDATDATDGDHELIVSKSSAIVDKVAYEHLIPSKAYELVGKLMDKQTGKPLLVGDREVVVKKSFTPNLANGTVEMEFEIDSTELTGKEVVVFEELSKDGKTVATHADIADAAQTVRFTAPPEGGVFDKTGNLLARYWWVAAALIGVAGALGAAGWHLRRSSKDDGSAAGEAEQK